MTSDIESLIAGYTTPATECADWCAEHIPAHISKDSSVIAQVDGELTEMFISLEQEDVPGALPQLRLSGATDAPMTPATALELAAQLTHHAYKAMFR